jgi:hypothetical protein
MKAESPISMLCAESTTDDGSRWSTSYYLQFCSENSYAIHTPIIYSMSQQQYTTNAQTVAATAYAMMI